MHELIYYLLCRGSESDKTPKLIYLTEDIAKIAEAAKVPIDQVKVKGVVFIECEYLPESVENEVEIAERISKTLCRTRCGFWRDAVNRGYNIICFNPKSPVLAQLKQNLQ